MGLEVGGLEYSFADFKSQKIGEHGMEDLISQKDDDDISLTSFYDDEDKTVMAYS